MQIDRFTIKAQEALAAAQQSAAQRHNPQIETEHLLAALLDQEAGLTVPILERLGADHHHLRAELQSQIARFSTIQGATQLGLSTHLRETLETAQREDDRMKDMTSNIGSQWILDPELNEVEMNSRVSEAMRLAFKPEFLNRVDETVIFHRLSLQHIRRIVELQLVLRRPAWRNAASPWS